MAKSYISVSKIITKLSSDNGISYRQAHTAAKTIINRMTKSLASDNRIEVRGFGSFVVREHNNKIVLNPKTGELLHDKNAYKIHFKPGQILRSTLLKQK